MTNKEVLIRALEEDGKVLGCWDDDMERLNKSNLAKVVKGSEYGSCDIQVCINRKKYIVEVAHVDNEVDFSLISASDYKEKYGRAYGED